MKSNDGRSARNWQAIARTDHGIRKFERLNILMAALRARSVLMDQACSINGRHKSAAENHGAASPLERNNVFRTVIDRNVSSVVGLCNNVVGWREQTQMDTVHACFLLEARFLIGIQASSAFNVCWSIRRCEKANAEIRVWMIEIANGDLRETFMPFNARTLSVARSELKGLKQDLTAGKMRRMRYHLAGRLFLVLSIVSDTQITPWELWSA